MAIEESARKTKENLMDETEENFMTPDQKEKCKKEEETDQSESEEESEDDYENQFKIIYPNYRNLEIEY